MEKFYKPERDKEFFDTCEEIRGQTKDYQSVEDIARKAIVRSASCFFPYSKTNSLYHTANEMLSST